MNIQHSSRTDSWGTPSDIIDSARIVLCGIDLDPASDAWFNARVRASAYLTDGLTHPWPSDASTSIFLNPPGGKVGNKSKTVLFWAKLMETLAEGRLKHAIFMAFSAEALQTTQQCQKSVLDFPLCIPRKRLCFVDRMGTPGHAPSHSNAIVYVPGSLDETEKFVKEFSKYGKVKV